MFALPSNWMNQCLWTFVVVPREWKQTLRPLIVLANDEVIKKKEDDMNKKQSWNMYEIF